jgi:cupin superfamily acireductone dioxygenase involved in methionine salvage
MGFVGVHEDSSDGATAVILDMLLKFGILIYNQNGTWKLHRYANLRRLYCFGDRKTIENSTAFVNKLSNRSLSFEESSMQAQIFLNASNRVMFLPGDWHTGMNMLQSIYKIFWADILKPFRDLLKWKRISNDVRGCYFQASQLVQYSNDVVSSYLIRLYISRYHEKYDDRMNDDETANVLCSMAVDFNDFLTHSLTSLDKHLILIVNFLLVSSDFLQFVQAYRAQDSISVENGYQTFAPIWKLLGQVKYLEATREQMENLYTLFPYSRLQEIRMNRQVRNYPGSAGKSAVAQDEWLELNNKEHANLPTVRLLEGMCRQGHYVGITQRCKRFIDAIYSAGSISERTIYRSGLGATGRGQVEKMLLAEAVHLFLDDGCLSHDNEQNFERKLQPGAIAALGNQFKTKLDQKKIR